MPTTHPANRNKIIRYWSKKYKIEEEEIIPLSKKVIDSFNCADYIIQIGNYEAVKILLDNGIKRDKIIHTHYGLNYKIERINYQEAPSLDNYLYSAASFGLRKGFLKIVDIFISSEFNQKKITLVGDLRKTENKIYWQEKLKELQDKNKKVEFRGYINSGTKEYNNIIKKNAYYVFPSLEEAEPGTVIEAMSAGLVPILSKESNIDFEIDDDFNISFQEKIKKTLSINKDRWEALSKKAIHYIEVFHCYKSWEKRLTEIFKMINNNVFDIRPTASIILTIYNKEKTIADLLQLLWTNTKSYNKWDLHIIYDGCVDETKKNCQKILNNFKIPVYEYETPDVFEIKANNLGLKNAKGKYCIILQDDNYIYEKKWLEKMLFWLEENPKVAVLGGLAGVNFFPLDFEAQGIGVNHSLFENHQRLDPVLDKKLSNFIFEADAVMRGPIVLRKELLETHGYLDEEYCPIYNDDMDYCFRMKKYGYSIFCYPIDVVNKNLTVAKYKNPEKEKFWSDTAQKNQKLFYKRWGSEIGKNHELYLKVPKPIWQEKLNEKIYKKTISTINIVNPMQIIYKTKNYLKNKFYKMVEKTPKPIIRKIILATQIIGGKFTGLSKKLHRHFFQKRAIPWMVIDGDKSLRLDYTLNSDSIVFDVGGYKGDWAKDIYCMYGCQVYIFEPVNRFVDEIKCRFKNNKRIHICNFGLSDQNKTITMSLDGNSSSEYTSCEEKIMVEMKDIVDFVNLNKIEKIDLIKINIEGGEYDLLEHLIESGEIKKIKNIQVQFHDFVPNAKERMKNIQKKLSRTHRTTYQFEFVWENWEINTL